MAQDDGWAKFSARLAAIPQEIRKAIQPALAQSGNELASDMRQMAEGSRDTGALIDSVQVTLPGNSTPAFSQPGGSYVAGENEVVVTVGNTDVRYPHLVEHGTTKTEAQPFFWPSVRSNRKKIEKRLKAAGTRAIKKAYSK